MKAYISSPLPAPAPCRGRRCLSQSKKPTSVGTTSRLSQISAFASHGRPRRGIPQLSPSFLPPKHHRTPPKAPARSHHALHVLSMGISWKSHTPSIFVIAHSLRPLCPLRPSDFVIPPKGPLSIPYTPLRRDHELEDSHALTIPLLPILCISVFKSQTFPSNTPRQIVNEILGLNPDSLHITRSVFARGAIPG